MESEPKIKRVRSIAFVTLLGTALVGGSTFLLNYLDISKKFSSYLDDKIDQRIEAFYAPQEVFSKAERLFRLGREDEGFDSLDNVINMCWHNGYTSREYRILGDALHGYLYYIQKAKNPEACDGRFKIVMTLFDSTRVPVTLYDKVNIGWHKFACGHLDEARNYFNAAYVGADDDRNLKSGGLNGLIYCSLADENLAKAESYYDEASEIEPDSYPNADNERTMSQATKAFKAFAKTSKKLNDILDARTAAQSAQDTVKK